LAAACRPIAWTVFFAFVRAVCAMRGWRECEARNEARFRDQNEWIEAMDERFGSSASSPVIAFVCECGDAECTLTVELTKAEYESVRSMANRFVLYPNHEAPDEVVVREARRFTVADKVEPYALGVARETDPRSGRRARRP
jgi:hypothetical protein